MAGFGGGSEFGYIPSSQRERFAGNKSLGVKDIDETKGGKLKSGGRFATESEHLDYTDNRGMGAWKR